MRWPLDYVFVTQEFGKTAYAIANPERYKNTGGIHEGIDLRAPIGTPVYAPESGRVTIGGDAFWGRWIKVEHQAGLASYFAHLKQTLVRDGERVSKGELIGYSGNTGNVAPHLHWSVKRVGKWVNPRDLISDTKPAPKPTPSPIPIFSEDDMTHFKDAAQYQSALARMTALGILIADYQKNRTKFKFWRQTSSGHITVGGKLNDGGIWIPDVETLTTLGGHKVKATEY